MSPEKHPFPLALGINAALMMIFFLALDAFPIPLFLPCTHRFAQSAILAFSATLIIYLGLGTKFLPQTTRLSIGLTISLIILALWLGSYPFSPLGFSTGRIPVLQEFAITTRKSSSTRLVPGANLTLASGLPAGIEPVFLLENVKCRWFSVNDGILESLEDCNTVYVPPQADYDILKINFQPGCGLPQASAQIKISILP